MREVLVWVFLTGALFFVFMVLLIEGYRKKNKRKIRLSILILFIMIICGCWTGYMVFKKLYNKAADIADEILKPRTGMEIYTALFNAPESNCVEVVNQMDQMVPRLDCCIWIEFKTCAQEIRRIASQDIFTKNEMPEADSTLDQPPFQPAPGWWKPSILGDSLVKLSDAGNDSNRARILLFSRDSTHAFYCDMAD